MPPATTARDSTGRIPQTPFRLDGATLAAIDRIAEHLTATTGTPANRAAAVRYAVLQTDPGAPPKSTGKKSGK